MTLWSSRASSAFAGGQFWRIRRYLVSGLMLRCLEAALISLTPAATISGYKYVSCLCVGGWIHLMSAWRIPVKSNPGSQDAWGVQETVHRSQLAVTVLFYWTTGWDLNGSFHSGLHILKISLMRNTWRVRSLDRRLQVNFICSMWGWEKKDTVEYHNILVIMCRHWQKMSLFFKWLS